MARLTDEERARLRAACEDKLAAPPPPDLPEGWSYRRKIMVPIDDALALLDERDALAVEVERLLLQQQQVHTVIVRDHL